MFDPPLNSRDSEGSGKRLVSYCNESSDSCLLVMDGGQKRRPVEAR